MPASGSPGRSSGSWTSGACGSSAASTPSTAGSTSRRTRTRAAPTSAAPRLAAATAATGSPWYFVSPTASTGRSANAGPNRGNGLRQVLRGQHADDPGHAVGGTGVDAEDPRPGAVERDELDVEHVLEAHVGEELLGPGDPLGAAPAGTGVPTLRQRVVTAGNVAVTAAPPAPHVPPPARPPRSGCSPRTGTGCRTALPGPARRRVRVGLQQARGRDHHAGDAEPALHRTLLEEGLLDPAQAAGLAQPFHGRYATPAGLGRQYQARVDAAARRRSPCTRRTRPPRSIPSSR